MKQKIANIRVSLPMVFLVAQLLNSWSLTTLIITGALVVGMYLLEKSDSRAGIFMMVGLAVELYACIMSITSFLRYGINHYYGIGFYVPYLAAQVVYFLLALVLMLKILKRSQDASNKIFMNILYGAYVAAIFFAVTIHYGTDNEVLTLSSIIWQVFKLVTLILIEQVYLRKLVPGYSLLRAAVLVMVVILVLSVVGGVFMGGGSPSVNRCRSCGRSFQAGAGGDFMSIARSGMCSDCYSNFQWGQQFIGK